MENGFKFSETKTTCVHFCQRRGCKEAPELTLHGKTLTVEREVKFLGLVVDRILSFKPHVEYLRKKCQKAMNLLKMFSHTDWGADREILLTLYKTYIQSRLDYGSVVYASAAKSYLDWLNPIQNQALRLCISAFRSSPRTSLHVEAGIPKLDLRRDKLSLQYAIKMKANERNPTHDTIFNEDHSVFRRKENIPKPFSVRVRTLIREARVPVEKVMKEGLAKSPPWTQTGPAILFDLCENKKGETESKIFKEKLAEIGRRYEDYTEVYTDGSKDGNRVGFAAYTPYGIRKGALHGRSSIFTAEAHALLSALEWMSASRLKVYIIFSDSKSCLQAINQYDPRNPVIQEIRQLISQLTQSEKEVVLCWLPSHIGIDGNEAADDAAKKALSRAPGPAAIPYSDLLPICTEFAKKKWQSRWISDKDNKLRAIEPLVGKGQDYTGLTRRESTRLTRLRIGHSLLTHGHLMKGENRPEYQRCRVPLTIEHLMLTCQATKKSRDEHLRGTTSMNSVFTSTGKKEVLTFLQETKIFEKL